MVPIVRVVGKSDTGKTTLLEKLIAEMVRRGHRVGTVKHDPHGVDFDTPGKDSWRHAEAGASVAAVASSSSVAIYRRTGGELPLEAVAAMLGEDLDIILAEGYKHSVGLKIEISRSAMSSELICSEEELLAVVSDVHHEVRVPQFGLDDVAGLADLLEKKVLSPFLEPLELTVNGKDIPIKGFVQDIIDRAIRGMVASLQGTDDAKEITIRMRRPVAGKE